MHLRSILAAALWIGGLVDASAQELEKQSAALKVIRETAADICYTVEQKGQQNETQLKGDIQAKVSGAVAKVLGLGVEGSGELTTEDYQGVTQEALATAIKSSADCRLTVFNSLVERMLPAGGNQPAVTAPPRQISSSTFGFDVACKSIEPSADVQIILRRFGEQALTNAPAARIASSSRPVIPRPSVGGDDHLGAIPPGPRHLHGRKRPIRGHKAGKRKPGWRGGKPGSREAVSFIGTVSTGGCCPS